MSAGSRVKTLFLILGIELLLVNPVATQAAPPQGDAGPDREMMAGDSITLQGLGNDPDGDPIIGWQWELHESGDRTPASVTGATTSNPTFTAVSPGVYVLTLVIDNGVELSEPDFMSITVTDNQKPVAVAEADQTSGPAPLTVNFNGIESTEPDFQALTYHWYFGDGDVGKGPRVTHQYAVPGNYLVTLAAADDHGAVDLATLEIVVTESDTPSEAAVVPVRNALADEGFISENSDAPESLAAEGGTSPVAAAAAVRDALAAAIQDALVDDSAAWGNATTTGPADNDLLALTQRVDSIVASLAELEDKLSKLQMAVESMQPPATVGTTIHRSASENITADVSKADVKELSIAKSASMASTRETLITAEDSGPWVINLASIRDKARADRFAARIESKGVRVQQNRALVRGTEYWRVQIAGFATEAEARQRAASVSENLGLTGVWITKR